MEQKFSQYKNKLLEEKDLLEKELKTVGIKNSTNSEWEATPNQDVDDADQADRNTVADEITDYENNAGILKQLQSRLYEVDLALEKIKSVKYGKCEICQGLIEEDRLQANPAARTCKKHINEKI
jgi:DnaK suppressor protein